MTILEFWENSRQSCWAITCLFIHWKDKGCKKSNWTFRTMIQQNVLQNIDNSHAYNVFTLAMGHLFSSLRSLYQISNSKDAESWRWIQIFLWALQIKIVKHFIHVNKRFKLMQITTSSFMFRSLNIFLQSFVVDSYKL